MPYLARSPHLHATDPLHWIQASFTMRRGGDFIAGPIRTRRNLDPVRPDSNLHLKTALLVHLRHSFPGRYARALAPIQLRGGGGGGSSLGGSLTLRPPETITQTPPDVGTIDAQVLTGIGQGLAGRTSGVATSGTPAPTSVVAGASALAGIGLGVGAGAGAPAGTGASAPAGTGASGPSGANLGASAGAAT